MRPNSKFWRESASLIILAKNGSKLSKDHSGYKVLVLKRVDKGLFPGSIVFPGGVIDPVDSLKDWFKLYDSLGIDKISLAKVAKVCGNRPPIFQSDSNALQREISLRITGIRETFEELGVLICKDKEEIKALNEHSSFASMKSDLDIKYWQEKVHNDPKAFFELCEKNQIVPDLWGTHEWCCWLTPTTIKARFETAYFLVALDNTPDVFPELSEVQDYHWKSPEELLSEYRHRKIILHPPQIYELLRLSGMLDVEHIAKFAKDRGNKGIDLLYPLTIKARNGFIHIFPGDILYPKNPNLQTYKTIEKLECLIEDMRPKGLEPMHRIEQLKNFNLRTDNFIPLYGQLLPKITTL